MGHSIAQEPLSLAECAERQRATYWRIRIHKTIDRLEYEARRMLTIEDELSRFCETYYAVVGDTVARLLHLEQQLGEESVPTVPELPEIELQCAMRSERQTEMKARYRMLAREIHPDRAAVVDSTGMGPNRMQLLNAAYERSDLAMLLRIEAQMLLSRLSNGGATDDALENGLHEVSRAADTYAQGYSALLSSTLNKLMLRSMAAKFDGWDLADAVKRRVERVIDEKERALALAHITAIGQWREAQAIH